MGTQTLHTCPICGDPMKIEGDHAKSFKPVHGIVVILGYSLGGWGRRRNWVEFSAEVCGDCYETLGKMLTPAVEFIRSGERLQGDNVQSVQRNQLSPEGRGKSLLRFLPSLHR